MRLRTGQSINCSNFGWVNDKKVCGTIKIDICLFRYLYMPFRRNSWIEKCLSQIQEKEWKFEYLLSKKL